MTNPLFEYYRCPEELADFYQTAKLPDDFGFFRLGDSICYGQCWGGSVARSAKDDLYDCMEKIQFQIQTRGKVARLPFDPAQVVDNLRMERYAPSYNRSGMIALFNSLLHRSYYTLRPALPVSVRKHFQKLHFTAREKIRFPHWPVDCTVDNLIEKLLRLAILAKGATEIPFIWFWPYGMSSAAIMTHDVETRSGRDFCNSLMDVNDSFGIKSSFQVIPEARYPVPENFLANIRARGFEVNVHDLNHDGHLFRNHDEFLRRIARINQYLREFDAQGFRAGVMYRNQEWFGALESSYDMSVPNAAHLDPQNGGCCTVKPYFVGKVLELPVTTTQDYPLFNILKDYSIALWRLQSELVMAKHGLLSFVVHPDYVMEERPRATYVALLRYLNEMRAQGNVWFALPKEINAWWRQRSRMKLVRNGIGWTIEGPGSERACIAFAHLDGDHISYSVERGAYQGKAPARGHLQ